MSDQPPIAPSESSPTPLFNLGPGLLGYYSSQAEMMLAQYENINRLLGPTADWTHPGDFCEVLFRDFLRKFLPPSLSADKGFFYGRAALDGKDTHCPEIDILIHDTQQYRPIFRMGDFVIVQPQAVRGMIQVKRTFSDSQVREGVKNVVRAKQHLANVLWSDNPKGWGNPAANPPPVFTGVVGFKDEIGEDNPLYRNLFLKWHLSQRAYDRQGMIETSMYVLPSFIGSLDGYFVTWPRSCNFSNQGYVLVRSLQSGANVCIQAFLLMICSILERAGAETLPFAFPEPLQPLSSFKVLEITEAAFNPDGTITIFRNDKAKGHYRKAAGPTVGDPHLRCSTSNSLVMMDRLRATITPEELFVQCDSVMERYERIRWEPTPEMVPKAQRIKRGGRDTRPSPALDARADARADGLVAPARDQYDPDSPCVQ